tara:strand:+ start:543 stop:710 length:168 start_codon:yes stop_codon:yes gene_type:complete
MIKITGNKNNFGDITPQLILAIQDTDNSARRVAFRFIHVKFIEKNLLEKKILYKI